MCVRFRIAPDKDARVPTVVIGLIVLLCASLPAAGTPPSPIAASDLELFARRLDLSGEQRQVMDEYYMAYLERYWQSGVASAPQDSRSAQLEKLPDEIPDLAAIRAALDARRRALTSMRHLDETFFSALQEILTEPQQQQMTRVRSLRERTLLMRDELVSEWYEQRRHLDLGLIVDNLDMTVEQRETARPSLEAYERNLTQLLRRLWEASGDMRRDWRRRLDREDIDPKEAWVEAAFEVRPEGLEAVAHNRLWIERIAAVLPERAAVVIRYQFDSSQFYRFLMYALIPARLHFAQSLDDLTDEQRESLRSLYHQAVIERVRLLERQGEMMEQFAYFFRMVGVMHIDFLPGTREERTARIKPINDMFRTVRDASNAMNKRIEAIIDKEQIAAVRKMVREHTRISARTELSFAKREASRKRMTTLMRGFAPPESYLYPPLMETEVELFAMLLQLTPQEKEPLLNTLRDHQVEFGDLYQQYTTSLDELRLGNFGRPIKDKPGRISSQYSPPEDVRKGFDQMDNYIEKVSALERMMKANFLSMVPEDRKDAAEALWQCRTITARPTPKEYFSGRGPNDYMLALRTDITQTDPMAPLGALDLTIGERSAILIVAVEEAETLHRAAEVHHTASLEAWKFFTEGICRMYARVYNSEGPDEEWNKQFNAVYLRHQAEVLRARHELIQNAWRFVNRLAEALEDVNAKLFLQTYHRRAFPVITYDPTSLHDRFDSAVRREDLNNQQRASLAQIRADYDSHYQRMARQLIDFDLNWEDAYARGEVGEGDRHRLEQAIDQLRFEREALNYVYGKKLENALE